MNVSDWASCVITRPDPIGLLVHWLHGAPLHFTVQISTDQLERVERLRELFTREWGQIDAFEGLLHGKDLPRPLVALDNSETLLGGLAFSTYKHPSREGHTLWINALLVIPSHRSNGIASRLVKEAECVASELGFNSLHVYTNVPSLYQRLSWRVVSTAGQHQVLTVDLEKPSR